MSMKKRAPGIVPIHSPWDARLIEAVKLVKHNLFLVSPYIKDTVISLLREILCSRSHLSTSLLVQVITRTLPEEFSNGSSDIDALQQLLGWSKGIPKTTVEIRAINNVHAKVWIFDTHLAFVGSGNATPPGLTSNLEYGLAVSDPEVIAQIQNDWQQWWEQAAAVTENQLAEMRSWLNEIKNNEEWIQIEMETDMRRKLAEQKVGAAPRIGKTLSTIPSNEKAALIPSLRTTRGKNEKPIQGQSISATSQSLWNDTEINRMSGNEAEPDGDDTTDKLSMKNKLPAPSIPAVIKPTITVSDPPWEKVADINSSPEALSEALWYHSSDILHLGRGE